MEKKKISFFRRFKKAIVNFDEYQNFGMEKLSTAIKYFIKIMLIFAVVVSIAITYKTYRLANDIAEEMRVASPEFKFENRELVIDGEKVELQKDNYYFNIIGDSTKTDIERDR